VWTETTRILIDTSPDFREQALAAGFSDLDAVIWTHDHADHCHGIDDLRQIMHARQGAPVRGLARPFTLAQLEKRFAYAFRGSSLYRPTVAMEPLPDAIRIGDIHIRVVDQPHGGISSAGLRFDSNGKSMAYAIDFNEMTEDMRFLYQDLDLWVADCLHRSPHPTHAHLDAVLGWVQELAPRRTLLAHMDNSMDYATLVATLPAGVEPGFDGMEIAI
jgi:phosphoribosyl 1,2-cyclic phosphate phosphodiesterase